MPPHAIQQDERKRTHRVGRTRMRGSLGLHRITRLSPNLPRTIHRFQPSRLAYGQISVNSPHERVERSRIAIMHVNGNLPTFPRNASQPAVTHRVIPFTATQLQRALEINGLIIRYVEPFTGQTTHIRKLTCHDWPPIHHGRNHACSAKDCCYD